MARGLWRKRAVLSPAKQLAGLRRFPSGTGSVKRDVLSWSMAARPTAFSLEYLIEVECRLGGAPDVYVSGGEIEKMDDLSEIPHHYSVDAEKKRVKICLDYGEWRRDQLIAATMVPWAVEWLAHFEIWLVTGKWTGGGIHNGVLEE